MEQKRLPIFAERFAELRGDMTQGEFAEYLGISRPTVGFYENGTRLPDVLILRQISERCNVSADWLIGLTGDREICPSAIDLLGLSSKAIEVLKEMNTTPANQLVGGILPQVGPLLINRILENKECEAMVYFTNQALLAGLKAEVVDSSKKSFGSLAGFQQSLIERDEGYVKVPTRDAVRLYMRSACDIFENIFETEVNLALDKMLQDTNKVIQDRTGEIAKDPDVPQ